MRELNADPFILNLLAAVYALIFPIKWWDKLEAVDYDCAYSLYGDAERRADLFCEVAFIHEERTKNLIRKARYLILTLTVVDYCITDRNAFLAAGFALCSTKTVIDWWCQSSPLNCGSLFHFIIENKKFSVSRNLLHPLISKHETSLEVRMQFQDFKAIALAVQNYHALLRLKKSDAQIVRYIIDRHPEAYMILKNDQEEGIEEVLTYMNLKYLRDILRNCSFV